MDYFNIDYGLITDNDPVTENGQLFLSEYILLAQSTKTDQNLIDYASAIMYTQLIKSYAGISGLYHRNPQLMQRTMSHDNLSGIMSYSFLFKTPHRVFIWDYLKKHFGTYDNTQGKSKQLSRFLPFNPANFFIWGLCAESKIYMLFLPCYFINLLLTCKKKYSDTSGKILLWVEMFPHRKHWLVKHLFNYYEKKMKDMYGERYVESIMTIYHGHNSNEFPINKLLNL